jgi:oligopeptide/dipeptide ABC transporter ATP-binding protein
MKLAKVESSIPLLSLRDLCTEFQTAKGVLRAVQSVCLDVMPSECVGIVGESGSGKSVTFASVMGLIREPGRVTSGEVLFDGVDLRKLSPSGMRSIRGKQMAMTMQDALTALNPGLTIEKQLCEVILAHDAQIAALPRWQRQKNARERALDMLNLVGIPSAQTRLLDYPHQFSGGMRQRIMIAIALACKPRLLIADEPTTALDVTIQAQVLDLLAGLRQRLGMSVVLITHDLGVVAEQCDRLVVMYAGQVVEMGPTADIIASPQHPYTKGLLAATPRIESLSSAVKPIAGTVPNLIGLQGQCHFYSRCNQRSTACLQEIPMIQNSPEWSVRCVQVKES